MSDEGCFWIGGIKLGGPGSDYMLTDVEYPTSDVRVQDVENTIGDGTRFGRDTITGGTFSFGVLVAPADGDVWGAMTRLAAVWRDPNVRAVPGRTMQLTFQRQGRIYTATGRPRKFQVDAGDADTLPQGALMVACDFKTSSSFLGVGDQRSVSLGLLQPFGNGGLIIPVDVPAILSIASSSDQGREGVFTVGGANSTPFTVEITGPVSGSLQGARVAGQGWTIDVTETISWGQKLVVDTATMTVTLNGVNLPGAVSARTRLSGRLQPGRQSFTFTGIDETASARATLRWYDSITI